MRTYLLLATCLILVGCGRQDESQREVLGKLETIKSELASKRADPVRWAFANKRDIDSAISQWSRDKMEEVKRAEALSPEVEEKVRQYETLQDELMRKRMETMGLKLPPRALGSEAPPVDKDYEALSKRVAEAKAPIADILERRARQASQHRDQYSTDKLIAEYVKGRFDLVVDSSEERFSRSVVLFRIAGEVLDITDGVIKLFKEKAKP
jgi:chromosome segregation ATPase